MFEVWEMMALDYEERKTRFQEFIKQTPHLTFYDYMASAEEFGFEDPQEIALIIAEVNL